MAIKVTVQRDYLLTEFSVSASAAELDDLLKAIKASGKTVTLYNDGCVQGINVEQKKKLTDAQATKVRELLGVTDVVL